MISLHNGHELDFACGSGALAFDGRGWFWERPLLWTKLIRPEELTIVAKTVTRYQRKGNLRMWHPWTCVRLVNGGAVNAIGLTNPGIKAWIEKYYPIAKRYNVACSIQPDSAHEAKEMAIMLSSLSLAYIEVNPSCPNVERNWMLAEVEDIIAQLHKHCDHPIVVKISQEQAVDEEFLEVLSRAKISAIHAINAVPWNNIFQKPSPIEKYTGTKGGVSGTPIKNHALIAVSYVHSHLPSIPIIGGGGIMEYDDVLDMERAGAKAFSIGTLFLRHPTWPNRIIKKYRNSQ